MFMCSIQSVLESFHERLKMNKDTKTLHKMIPLRIRSSLSDRLDSFHRDTLIPKNTIVQLSLNKFINEYESSDIKDKFKELYQL
jgi:predicted DNA-binding protein